MSNRRWVRSAPKSRSSKVFRDRYDSRSPEWFGIKIAERLGADKKDAKQMKIVTAILDDLIEEGTFKIELRKDATRRERGYVVPGVLAGVATP